MDCKALRKNLRNVSNQKHQQPDKRSRSQGPTHTFTLAHRTIETTKTYTYIGLKITPTGNFTLAVNGLKEKAQRAFYVIKRSIQIDIPIQIWLKLFKAVIEPIALYGSEVWGPSIKFDFLNWEKHPIETLQLDFCKRILKVQRKTPNNGCRAELGQYPLLLNIQKRAIKFWKHLKTSDPNTYHYKALKHQELSVSNGAFPLHGTVRFGTARLSSGWFAFPPQFSTAIEWAGLFTRRYNCAASTAVTSS